ncbi:hypothetical protein LCGC14_0547230 [marine sediment metagenome]|uniref:Uncharacterized protein n=1 Tax=marine sediment metagenome TaxID=412755 RepID=A0A0F9UCD8_9ZZZZ
MTTYIIIIAGVIAIIWIANKLKPVADNAGRFQTQVAFLKEYMKYTSTPEAAWVLSCSNREELVTKGQNKMWEASGKFLSKLETLSQNGFMVHFNDTEMLDQALAIVTAAHFIRAANNGLIKFSSEVKLCDRCDACRIEKTGCACDSSYESGCFFCSPDNHVRPECPKGVKK